MREVGRNTFRLAPANEFVNKAIDIRICFSLFNRRINRIFFLLSYANTLISKTYSGLR